MTDIRHYDSVTGRVHEGLTAVIRGEAHPLAVQYGPRDASDATNVASDAEGLRLLNEREARIAAKPAQYENTGKEFLRDKFTG